VTTFGAAAARAVGMEAADWESVGAGEPRRQHLGTRRGLLVHALLFELLPECEGGDQRSTGVGPGHWGCSAMHVETT
jgi:hypothetical protein